MTMLSVPIAKAKQNLEVDSDLITDERTFQEIFMLGLKAVLTRGMTKITTTGLEGEELDKARTAAFEKAKENLVAVYEGKIRFMSAKASKTPRAVTTEALRQAREDIKEQMKASGIKLRYVKASQVTAMARALIADDPSYLENANKVIAERAERSKKIKIDVSTIELDEEKMAEDAKEKEEAGKVLSALQAGKVKVRPIAQQ